VLSSVSGEKGVSVGWNYSPEGYGQAQKKSIDLNSLSSLATKIGVFSHVVPIAYQIAIFLQYLAHAQSRIALTRRKPHRSIALI
jgi:hypothetical protein